jgi:hypothetical protein
MVSEENTIELNIHDLAKRGQRDEITWLAKPARAPLIGKMRAWVSIEGERGWIRLFFKHADGEKVDQCFDIVAVPSCVGGIKWYGNFIDAEGLGIMKYSKIHLAPSERLFTTRHERKRRPRRNYSPPCGAVTQRLGIERVGAV